MKKIFTPLLFIVLAHTLRAQIVNIPDTNFLNLLVNGGVDTSGDGQIQVGEAQAVTNLILTNANIADLTGLEAFTNLTSLQAFYNSFSTVDVSNSPNLEELRLGFNSNLVSINLTGLSQLDLLSLGSSSIANIDLSTNTALKTLGINTSLISSIDLSNNLILESIYISSSNLDSLGVSHLDSLKSLNILFSNLSDLDLSQNTVLSNLGFDGNNITAIDLTNNTKLSIVSGNNNPLSSINLIDLDELSDLRLNTCSLSNINLTTNTALTTLRLNENQLSSIDLSQNTLLESLYMDDNDFTSIDLSDLSNLRVLNMQENNLSYLDLSANLALTDIKLIDNQLISLDLSGLPNIGFVNIDDNELQYLNVANGNNAGLYILDARDNSDLYCIQIDTGFTPPAPGPGVGWYKDAQAAYNGACTPTCTDVTFSENQVICFGETYTVGGITYDTTTIHRDTIQVGACDSIYVLLLTVRPEFTVEIEENNGTLSATSGMQSYQWYVDGSAIANATSANYVVAEGSSSADYYCVASNSFSCYDTSNVLTVAGPTTGIRQQTLIDLNIYPNPANNWLTIETSEDISSVQIFDLSGRLVLSNFSGKQVLELSGLDEGIYLIQVEAEGKLATEKLIIKQ